LLSNGGMARLGKSQTKTLDLKAVKGGSPWHARTMLVNHETGELKDAPDGLPVFVRTKHHAGRHMSTLMEALEAVATDTDLNLTDHRVLRLIESRVEYANTDEGYPDAYVRLVQAELATVLKMSKPQVNRAIKKLLERKIILRMAPQGQASQYFAINPNYGWRGKHKEWKNRRGESPKLSLLKGGQDQGSV
jgi:DNA-binding MarR family transcriptional regulator